MAARLKADLSQATDPPIDVKSPHGVLVVDDDPPLRDLLKFALEGFGFRVFLAEDGVEALEIFEKNNVSILSINETISIQILDKAKVARINEQLVLNRIDVYEIQTVKSDLEQIFFDVLKD